MVVVELWKWFMAHFEALPRFYMDVIYQVHPLAKWWGYINWMSVGTMTFTWNSPFRLNHRNKLVAWDSMIRFGWHSTRRKPFQLCSYTWNIEFISRRSTEDQPFENCILFRAYDLAVKWLSYPRNVIPTNFEWLFLRWTTIYELDISRRATELEGFPTGRMPTKSNHRIPCY